MPTDISSANSSRANLPIASVIQLDGGALCVKFSYEAVQESANWRYVSDGNVCPVRTREERYPAWTLVSKPDVVIVEPENVVYVIDAYGYRWNRNEEDGMYTPTNRSRKLSFARLVREVGPITPYVQKFEALPPVGGK